jgi:hypothetical protein
LIKSTQKDKVLNIGYSPPMGVVDVMSKSGKKYPPRTKVEQEGSLSVYEQIY